ncbi:hypothetical protein [Fibrobacter sp. UWB5]|uniref:InlB B-repeat-containing protein n=1 Tax=Fibrobacter sp. UWB5 TaxID=1964360 RepID=UPI000B5267BE|nr:hypothetical protein [Fibrobacter sp. UWB5]OWV11274.1 hypothetical protein B7989_09500 [Fibrobacter sp. UWB5]
MPKTGTVNASIPAGVKSFKVYDDGGSSKDYSKSSNGTLVLTAPTGYVFELTGNVKTGYTNWEYGSSNPYTCNANDNLSVYDGSSISATALVSAKTGCTASSGPSNSSLGRIISRGNTLTLNFKSNGTGYASDGLNLTVKLHKLALDLAEDGNGNKYVDMVAKHNATLTIPDGVTTFKVYDDGGKNDDYMKGVNDTLVLTAPSGYVLQLTGDIRTGYANWEYGSSNPYTCNANDNLSVYNGSSTTATSLLSNKTSNCTTSGGPTNTSLSRLQSSGQSMTLVFKSNATGYSSNGLDLTVKVVPIVNQIVYENTNAGGSVTSSSPTTANIGATVNYTYSYSSGYLVSDIKVVAENGDAVKASGGWYKNKTATFTMPPSKVTVKSTYTNDWSAAGGLYIDMPKTGTVNASIPAGVKSFKVYDDGGSSKDYSKSSNGTLVLTAPTGYVFELTGNVKTGYTNWEYGSSNPYTCNANDNLSVYDGSSISATALVSAKTGCTASSGPSNSSLGRIISRGNTLTLNFKSNGTGYASDGLNLTVKLHKLALDLAEDGNGNKYVDMVAKHNATLTIPDGVTTFKVYDDGGKNDDYMKGVNDTLVLTAPSGYVLQLTGDIRTGYANWEYGSSNPYTCNANDNLSVYNGSSTTATSLLSNKTSNCTTSGGPTNTSLSRLQSSGQSMTLVFKSNATGYSSSGLDLTVKVVKFAIAINSAAGGTVVSSKNSAITNDVITLTATPNSGYMFSGVTVKDASENVIKSNNSSFTTAVFTMPASDVSVTPTFTNTFTAAGGLHLDFVRNKKNEVNIPSGVASFKIYDNGGKDKNYESSSRDTIVLKAPTGYRLTVTGNIKTEKGWDSLYVFDGANTDNEYKLFGASSATSNTETSVGSISSTGEYMTLRFKSDGSNEYEGLDLTVTLEKINYTITLKSVTGGTLYSNVTKAVYGTEVSLNGIPTSGYRLSEATYVTASGAGAVALMHSFDRAVFTMPTSNVDVYPTWTTNLTAEGGMHLDMPRNVRADVNIPSGIKSFNLYDNGGKNGRYENSSKDTLTLNAPTGFYLVVTGTIALETGCDSLYIFDGKNTSATKLFGGTSTTKGSSYSIPTITSSGESLTFRFKSDGTVVYSGFNLKVSVEPITYVIAIADAANGRVSSSVKKAAKDSIVNLSWVYTTGYLIRDIDVKDASNNKVVVNGGWYSGANASFVMPGKSVTVTPTFTNNLTATGDDGLYINMPVTGTINAEIPANVKSFKVYDDGGKDNAYSNYCNGMLVLTAPEGYALELSGTLVTENPYSETKIYDYLNVYDGADKNANIVRNQITGSANVGTVRSSGRNLTLFFYSDGVSVMSGLDLTVTLVRLTINIAKVTGGAMTSDKEIASSGETVTLTATAEEGYLFDGVSVEDADGNSIALGKDIHWYSGVSENVVTFSMPANSVTVTPKFSAVNDLYVNVPKTGMTDVYIPENVASFKVYDDGGKDGNYSHNVQGKLNITVANGASNWGGLKVSGTVAAREGDKLSIYAHAVFVGKEFYTYEGSADGKPVDIGTYSNTALLRIDFESGETDNAAGLDLKVELLKSLSVGGSVSVVYDDAHFWTESEKVHKLALVKDDDMTASLNILEDVDVDSINFARKFTTDVYSTIVFPADFKADSLTGAQKVLRFNGFKQKEDESWVVRMKRVWTTDSIGRDIDISANSPYLVVMDDATLGIRGGVTLKKTVEPIAMAENCNWKFIGTLAYHEWPDGDPLVYGFKDNQFVKAGSNVSVKPLRAYLLKPEPKQASGRPSLNGSAYTYEYIAPMDIPDEFDIVEDDDENGENTTVIGRYNTRTGEFKMLPSYDIKGRKLNGKPNVHKAYYGKKVIRK